MDEFFPDCETGAVLPFGSYYGLGTVVDSALTEEEYIVFGGNTHEEAVVMRFADFQSIEHPQQAVICERRFD